MTVAKFILQPKTELSEDELKEYQKAYYRYLADLLKKIQEEFGVNITPLILEKTASPFQYWLVNELICKKINDGKK